MKCFRLLGAAWLCLGMILPATARQFGTSDDIRPMALRNMPFGRSFDDSTSGTINPNPRVPKPRIISKTEWGGWESTGTMKSHFPVRLTFHHEGGNVLKPGDDPKKLLRNLQNWGLREKHWPDIP